MKHLFLSAIFALFCTSPWAETLQCTELKGFVHSAYTGWQLPPRPNDFKPLPNVDVCALSSAADAGALCIKKTSSPQAARYEASLWLKELSTCLDAKQVSPQLKKITVGTATHEIMEFELFNYRGMPMKMNLRMQSEAATPDTQVTWYIAPQPGNKEEPAAMNICPMIAELTNAQSLSTDWLSWQGPVLEKGDGFTQFICAKVPHQAASRFDCDLRVTPQSLVLSSRWLYSGNLTDKVGVFASDIAQKIASCDVGMEWKKGSSRHVIDVPKKQVRIEVLSNKNDVGRGPSVTMTVQHWKRS